MISYVPLLVDDFSHAMYLTLRSFA